VKLVDRVSKIIEINGHQIKYDLKSARKDIRHLVVLLNGYRHGGWEYGNSIDFLKCNVLMIEDFFDSQQSCYLGKERGFVFADMVASLIDKMLIDLGLSKADCTLLGPSKGGFAALYIGIKFGYKNIVAPAFVGHIGSWMVNHDKSIGQHVMGNYDLDTVKKYDSLFTNLIANDNDTNKNIYVFVSPNDSFYLEYGQKEVIKLLAKKYTNFNLFITGSQLAFQHDQVTPYYLQETLSTVSLLTQSIAVRLPESMYENQKIQMKASPSIKDIEFFATKNSLNKEQAVNEISKILIKDHTLYVEGLAFILNYDSPNHSYLSKKLYIENIETKHGYSYIVGTVPNYLQSRLLFSNSYQNYAASGMATMGFNGIAIQNLSNGQYKLGISVTKTDQELDIKDLNLIAPIDKKYNCGESEYRIFEKSKSVYLTKRPVIGRLVTDKDCFFSLEKFWYKNDLYHLEGIFIVLGIDMPDFHLGRYYLVAKHVETGEIYSHGLGQVRNNKISKKIDSLYGGYDACYFATMHFKGIETECYDTGEYEIFISLSYKSEIFTYQINRKLFKNDGKVSLIESFDIK